MTFRARVLAAMVGVSICAGAGSASAAVPAWTTYHHDPARTGIDPDSASPVTPNQIWQTPALDGSIWGQPLVYGSRVYVATENDTVYALDAASGAIVWRTHLATPVDASVLCGGDIDPTVGITSTPVIDPAAGRIYVVADTWDGTDKASIAHEMYALSLSDGTVAVGPVPVDPPGSYPPDQLQRPGLALDAGRVIIGFGGNDSDCGNYHGWLVSVAEAGGPLEVFEADSQSGDSQGAIWGSGNAPPVDSSGNVWASTGNGSSTNPDFSESVIRFDANMHVLDWWAPSDWQYLDQHDVDVGSTMPLLLPGGLVFEIGKQGVGYLLSQSDLGSSVGPPVYSQSVCNGSWGGGIYYNGVIYVACADGMHALSLDTASRTFTPLSTWTVDANAISPPIEAGGLIWSADYNGSNLYGLDPNTGDETFVSGSLNGFEHFATPSAAAGRLFVANQDASASGDDVTAFQIANPPGPTATGTALSSSADPSTPGSPVTFTAAVSPGPDAGTVAFSEDGAPIPGCSVSITAATNLATCTTSFPGAGTHTLTATYSGDAYYGGSSAALTQIVASAATGGSAPAGPETTGGTAPVISQLHVGVFHQRLRLRLLLSEPGWLKVAVARLIPGRLARGRCRAGAKHGRRCHKRLAKATLRLAGRAGHDFIKPRIVLAPGRYTITVTAIDAQGRGSRPRTVTVTVPRSRKR